MVNMENYEEYMLLEADGELTEAEQKALHAFMDQHPELKNEMDLFMAVKLEPDASLVYEAKNDLLKTMPGPGKRTIGLGAWWTYGAVAACIALAILLFKKPGTDEAAITNTIAHTSSLPADTNQAIAKPAQELHSTPNDPVAMENERKTQPAPIAKKQKNETSKAEDNHTTTQHIAVQEPNNIKGELPVENNLPEPIEQNTTEEFVQTETEDHPVQQPTDTYEEKAHRNLLAIATVQDKFEGFADIKEAVNGKIERVKNIKNKIKDTDIQFRFGNTELFTVKL